MNDERNTAMWNEYLAGEKFTVLGRKYNLSSGRVAQLMHKRERKMQQKLDRGKRFNCEMKINDGLQCIEQCDHCGFMSEDEFWQIRKKHIMSV